MKYLAGITLSLFMVIVQIASMNDVSAQSNHETEAEIVLFRYFDALKHGDVLTMKSLMSESFLQRRQRLLDNPAYPAYLVETFGTVDFTVVSINVLDGDYVEIDAKMTFGKDDIIIRRYLMSWQTSPAGVDRTYLVHMEFDSP